MEQEKPQAGEFYRHFKGNKYKIVTLATHSETMEEMVVYEALYADGGIYVRPLEMFMSEVDHEKYPDVGQKYRFERIEEEEPLLIRFLDLKSNEEKVEFIQYHRAEMDHAFLSAVAESLDYTDNEKDIEKQTYNLLHLLNTRIKYESARMR